MSLTEVLVAFAILAIVMVTALLLYDDLRRALSRGEDLIDQQQEVRITFDQIRTDLALAGYNIDPSGETGRPDEAVEAAFDTAIVVRADYDDDGDGSGPTVPELTLAGGAFEAVSTGNDEIVAFALGKPGGTGLDTLSFEADLSGVPRDGVTEQIDVSGVALIQDDPPYTLYKISFDDSGNPVRLPLADNVLALRFRYFDRGGAELNPTFDLASLADDIGGGEDDLALDRRRAIHRVEIDLVGETRRPDKKFKLDAAAIAEIPRPTGRNEIGDRRRYRLTSDVIVENIGKRGLPDVFAVADPPTTPSAPDAYPGHCEGLYVDWDDAPVQDDVEYYRLYWGTSPGQRLRQYASAISGAYIDGLTDETDYFLSVQAVSTRGAPSGLSTETTVRTVETTTPDRPSTMSATTDREDEVQLAWSEVTDNVSNLPGDPESPQIRELDGYAIYRVDSPAVDLDTVPPIATMPARDLQYVDDQVVRCQDYHYAIRAVDRCGVESAPTSFQLGKAVSTTPPAAPSFVEAYDYIAGQVRLTWQHVDEDSLGETMEIDRYRIYRTGLIDNDTVPTDADFSLLTEVDIAPPTAAEYLDLPPAAIGSSVYYRVTAVDRCPNESAPSEMTTPNCGLVGEVWFENPPNRSFVDAPTEVDVRVTPLTGPYDRVELTFTNLFNGSSLTVDLGPSPTNRWTYNDWSWVTSIAPYQLTATLYKSETCTMVRSIRVFPTWN